MARRRDNDDVTKIGGFTGFVHKVVMFLTFPLRHWLICLIVLAVIAAVGFLVPVKVYNVAPKEVCGWYMDKLKTAKSQISSLRKTEPKGTDILVENSNSQAVRRQMFARAQRNSPYKVDVLSEQADNVVDIKDIRRAEEVVEAPQIVVAKPVVQSEVQTVSVAEPEVVTPEQKKIVKNAEYTLPQKKYSGLDYLDEPKNVSGDAVVLSVNELMVDGADIFLYGIYASPSSEKGIRGREFLKNVVKGEKVECKILAYTQGDKIATGECFVNGENLSKLLVEQGYSKPAVVR